MSIAEIAGVAAGLGGLLTGLAALITARVKMDQLHRGQVHQINVAVEREKGKLERWLKDALEIANGTIADLRRELAEAMTQLAGCEERDRLKAKQIDRMQGELDGLKASLERRHDEKPHKRERRVRLMGAP